MNFEIVNRLTMSTNPIYGRWLIDSMTEWDDDFINAEMRGYFEFGYDGTGSFHFGYVHGVIDYRLGTRDGKPCAEFTWEGNDEMDSAKGRGWAVNDGDDIEGMLFFHQGDESGFKAKRKKK